MSGQLFVVATPIGNLGDITLRAIDTLREVDVVLAEDTRRTRALLSHLDIKGKPVERFDANASPADVARWVARLSEGASIALVTDAGTPLVSDPGASLVAGAHDAGVRVVPIPGPSAVMSAVSAAGIGDGRFLFLGFLPRAGTARREALAAVARAEVAVVLFESPRRVVETLADLAAKCPDRRAAITRELTKVHEEIAVGRLAELAEAAGEREWLGEITLLVAPASAGETHEAWSDEAIDRRIAQDLAAGRRAREIAELLAIETGRPKREIYARVLALRDATR